MIDKLHQINITYSAREDRLLLRITTKKGDEYRIWLTRRFTTALNELLIREMDKYGGIASVRENRQTKKLFKEGAFEKSFEKEKSVQYPLGEDGFLAFAIKSTNTREGNLHLELLPERGKGVTMNLDKSLLYMFYHLLTHGIGRAEWHITTGFESSSMKVH